jgi:hypothetical protein
MIALPAPSYRGSPNESTLDEVGHPHTQDMACFPFTSPRRWAQPVSVTVSGGMLLGVDGKEWSVPQGSGVVEATFVGRPGGRQ